MPHWVTILAIISLAAAIASAVVVLLDIVAGHKQRMWIMDLVWPLTTLWSGPIGLYISPVAEWPSPSS